MAEEYDPIYFDVEIGLEFDGSGTSDAQGVIEIINDALECAQEKYFGEEYRVTRIEINSS